MNSFTFEFFGETADFTANYVPFDMANNHFNPSNGAWVEGARDEPYGTRNFRWVTGNFFD